MIQNFRVVGVRQVCVGRGLGRGHLVLLVVVVPVGDGVHKGVVRGGLVA